MFIKNITIKLDDKMIFQLYHPRHKMGIFWVPVEKDGGNIIAFRLVNSLGMPVHPVILQGRHLMATYEWLCDMEG